MSIFSGSAAAMITPFGDKGIRFDTMAQLIEMQIKAGTAALVINGTTGEPATVSLQEKRDSIAFAVKQAAGRVPVIAGSGTNDTAEAVMQSRQAKEAGADALLVVTPYYNKANLSGLVAHYHAICDVGLPVILYNVPSRTGLNVTAPMLKAIAQHPNLVAVKEASASVAQMMAMKAACPELDFYCGCDELNLAELACGCEGIISVAADVVPELCANLVRNVKENRLAEALDIQKKINPLIGALFCEVNPIPVKTALGMMGYAVGPLRLPLGEMEAEHCRLLHKELADLGLVGA